MHTLFKQLLCMYHNTSTTNFANTVNLFVNFSAMMVSFLTSSSYSEWYPSRMPGSNTGNFAQTFMRFTLQFARMPARSYTLKKKTNQWLSTLHKRMWGLPNKEKLINGFIRRKAAQVVSILVRQGFNVLHHFSNHRIQIYTKIELLCNSIIFVS